MANLHPQLQQDCIVLGKLELCHLLLMDDANYPWFILVPDREGVSEIFELDEVDQQSSDVLFGGTHRKQGFHDEI